MPSLSVTFAERSPFACNKDDDEEEKKIYKYEGEREPGDVVEVSASAGSISKTELVTLLGARSGNGKAAFTNNDVYEGAFQDGLRHGFGKYTYAAAPPADEDAAEEEQKPVAVYEGAWIKGEKFGIGTMTYSDGGKYQGSWANGKRSGIGTFYYPNGDIYSGDWQQGKKHGYGTYMYKETQARLKATWEKGACVMGDFTDRYGNVYKGQFCGDPAAIGYVHGGKFSFASEATATTQMPVNTALAKTGYCPVSYYSPKGPHVGSVDFPVNVHGTTYLLSPGAVEMFRADPFKYIAQFGGFCTVGVSLGKNAPIRRSRNSYDVAI